MFSNNEIIIANYTTQTTFYHENPQSNISLNDWLKQWISETTEEDLKEIELYKKAKRKHVKYKEGDFFSFKIGRRKWGFGRIVLNIAQLRKSATFMAQKNYGLTHLMGQALYIMIYQTIADTTEIDINGLRQCKTFPVQAIMDNTIYYGEYKIIGNLPVTTDEWEPIISYGRSISGQDKDTVYLQYGMIFKETTIDKFDKYLRIENIINPYRKEKIGFSINSYHILANEMKSLVTVQRKRKSTDLRDPENIEIKREIFSFFGLDADKSYAENLKLVGIND